MIDEYATIKSSIGNVFNVGRVISGSYTCNTCLKDISVGEYISYSVSWERYWCRECDERETTPRNLAERSLQAFRKENRKRRLEKIKEVS